MFLWADVVVPTVGAGTLIEVNMSNLTVNRGGVSALYLNGLWENVRNTMNSVLPQSYQYLEDKSSFHNLKLEETDPEASEVINAETLIIAFVTKVNRLMDHSCSLEISDNTIDFSVFDKIGEYGGRVSTLIPNIDDLINPGFTNPNQTNRFWVNTIFENQYTMTHQPNLVELKDYILDDSMVTFPSYLTNPSQNNNFAMSTFFNSVPLSLALSSGSNQLLIGNEDSDFIDINLNSSSSSQRLANMNLSKDRVPIKNLSIQNPKSVVQNSFIRTEEGLQVPISLLPKTTLTKALDLTVRSNLETEQNVPYPFTPHTTISFDISTSQITSYQKFINNQSGQGFFSIGYLGTEEFEDFGFDNWNIGKKSSLVKLQLGLNLENVETFGNGFDDWFVGEDYEVSKELNWNGYTEGTTPQKPCSSDSTTDSRTDNLVSQINGSNQTFATTQSYESGTLKVYWNGQRQHDLTITELTATTFRTSFIPIIGNAIIVDYKPF